MAFPLLLIGIVEYTLLYVTLHIETCFPVYEVTFAKLWKQGSVAKVTYCPEACIVFIFFLIFPILP